MQFGGVIYSDSADKATRFIANCNQRKIPLVFLQDVTGFMVGSKSEHGGIIKDGAKMVNAVSNSVVPKFTIITGNSFGAGNYAMCGKAYDPRLIAAWPWAELAVMGGAQAAKVLLQIQEATLKKTRKKNFQLRSIRNFWIKLPRIIISRLRQLILLPDYGQMLLSTRLIPESGLAWGLRQRTTLLLQRNLTWGLSRFDQIIYD